jgi:hypothetical protein
MHTFYSNFEKFRIIIKTGVFFVDKNTETSSRCLFQDFYRATKIPRASREDDV